jgi:hypothetical protein
VTSEQLVLHTDLELWAAGYIRARIAELSSRFPVLEGFEVTNREPDEMEPNFPAKLIVVRDDSGPTLSVVSQEKSLGVSTLMGTVEDQADAKLAALLVFAIMEKCASEAPGNPVASVTESNGPYLVTEDQPRARLYSTHTLIVTGQVI